MFPYIMSLKNFFFSFFFTLFSQPLRFARPPSSSSYWLLHFLAGRSISITLLRLSRRAQRKGTTRTQVGAASTRSRVGTPPLRQENRRCSWSREMGGRRTSSSTRSRRASTSCATGSTAASLTRSRSLRR